MMNATAMTYSTSQINRDFRIKVYGYNNSDERLNLLVGVSGLIRLVGEELEQEAQDYLTNYSITQ